jgi:unsaturated chondroitin disaccharide hydrolase
MQRLASLALASIACLASAARASPLNTEQGIATDLTFIEGQVAKTLKSLGSPSSGYPVSGGDSGKWTTTSPSSGGQGWASGFFPGELWLLYKATRSTTWLNAAETWTTPLASQASSVTRVDPTDIGFIIGTSFGNAYRLTGETSYKNVLLTAGASLASLYNSKVGAVRSWTFGPWQFPVIIDSMMTLGPLQWGATNGGKSTWATDAATHAQTVSKNLVRANGSTFELANFDPTTGARLSQGTFAGYSNSSTWARGEAWALYGFVQAYEASDDHAFLTTAEDIANYFVSNLPKGRDIPYWDFNAPVTPTTPVDTSAAAIAADGLIMLSTVAGKLSASYVSDAENILGALNGYLDKTANGEAVLLDGYPGCLTSKNTALIFSDYYFTEALLRLQDVLDGKPGWVLYSPADPLVAPELSTLALYTPAGDPVVPEPSTWAMMLIGFAGLAFVGYRARVRTCERMVTDESRTAAI